MPQITKDDQRETKPAPGVIATRPTTAPVQAPTMVGFPNRTFSINIQEKHRAAVPYWSLTTLEWRSRQQLMLIQH